MPNRPQSLRPPGPSLSDFEPTLIHILPGALFMIFEPMGGSSPSPRIPNT